MKKLFMGVAFALVCCVALTFTNTVNADEPSVNAKYASVKDNTQADSLVDAGDVGKLNPKVDIAKDGEEITVTYDAAKLKIVEESKDIHRPAGYAWIGLRMTAPNDAKYCQVKGSDTATKFDNKTFDEYFGISEAKLKASIENESNQIVYNYVITWYKDDPSSKNGDSTNTISTQTIKVIVKTEGVELYDTLNGGDKTLWNKDVYEAEVKKVEDAKKAAQQNTPKKEDKKDTTPQTGVVDYNIYIVIATAIVALGGIFAIKKLVR